MKRRSRGIVPMLSVIAVLATGGAIAAQVAHVRNSARLALFRADPACGAVEAGEAREPATRTCIVGPATVSARWVHRYKSSRAYRLALAPPDGPIDSVGLEGVTDKIAWNAAMPGSAATIVRFAEAPGLKPHVTQVRIDTLTTITSWNPEWQDKNTSIGVWFLGITAASCVVALLRIKARRAAANPDEHIA